MVDPILVAVIANALLAIAGIVVTVFTKVRLRSKCWNCFSCFSTPDSERKRSE